MSPAPHSWATAASPSRELSFETQLQSALSSLVMKHADLRDENCAVARSAAIVGERWVWVILRQAFNGARRFEDYQRGIGLARNVLTDRLNWLVDHGILERRRYAEHAARELNEYRLTAKGGALFPVYVALMQWGNEWTDLPAPPVDLLHKLCGQRASARVVCSEGGEELDGRDTEPVVGVRTSL